MMDNYKFFRDPSEKFIQIPNEFFDELMPVLPASAFKIICFIYRKTRGWNKDIDRISITQIVAGTGIKSDRTVRNALKYLKDENFISVYEDGTQTLCYGLNMRGKNDPGKNYRSTPVKITAVEAETPVKITDTKDIPEIQEIQMPPSGENDFPDLFGEQSSGDFGDPQNGDQPIVELSEAEKAHLQTFGILPNQTLEDQIIYAIRQELNIAGWEIHSLDVEMAICYFVWAIRQYYPKFDIPRDTPTRKLWYKAISGHLQNYSLDKLAHLYKQAIIKMRDADLSCWQPGSLTKWALPEVANENAQPAQDIDLGKGFYV